jgi:hypothetical protein
MFDLEMPLLDLPVSDSKVGDTGEFQVPTETVPGPLFFDLETIPDESRELLFGFEPLPEAIPENSLDDMPPADQFLSQTLRAMTESLAKKNPPDVWISEVRDAEKAAKKPRDGVFRLLESLRSGARSIDALKAERCKTMSVTPEFCRIAAIGVGIGDSPAQAILCPNIDVERDALGKFWDCVAKVRGPVVGFNILGFDIPVILVRSAILGVTPTISLANVRPWDDRIAVDLMERRFRTRGAMKLKDLARYYGLQVDAEGVDGSQVAALFRDDPQKVAEYVISDVELTRRLFRFWSGYFC